jgi:hypothetical protein
MHVSMSAPRCLKVLVLASRVTVSYCVRPPSCHGCDPSPAWFFLLREREKKILPPQPQGTVDDGHGIPVTRATRSALQQQQTVGIRMGPALCCHCRHCPVASCSFPRTRPVPPPSHSILATWCRERKRARFRSFRVQKCYWMLPPLLIPVVGVVLW